MINVEVPYGRGKQVCSLPDSVNCVYGRLKQVEPSQALDEQIEEALKSIIGDININKLKSAKSVAIAVSDITRPVPSKIILEQLLPWLEQFGIASENITVLVGGGLHRPANSKDLEYMFGDHLLKKIKNVIAHDADCEEMLVYLGKSTGGTPIYVNKYFAQADYKIVIGMVDAHQFMGFTAGVKGAVIGLGGRPTITGNHALLLREGAELGRIQSNPARKDLEDIGRIIGVDMIINVVLNDKKKVIKAVAGHPVDAHRKAVEFAKDIFGVSLTPADIVIASPGGFPKDINVYQAQKALTPAMHLVKKGGTIILVAQCIEGSGEESFEHEMAQYSNPIELVQSFQKKEFVIGPHKAYLWARTLGKANTIIVSDVITPKLAKTLMVNVKTTLQEAVNLVLPRYSNSAVITVLPYASSVIPILSK